MKWLDGNVGPANRPLEQCPVIFQPVCMGLPVYIFHGVIHDLVGIFTGQAFIREKEVGIQRGTSFNVLANLGLKRFLLSVRNYCCPNLSATLKDADNWNLVFGACPGNAALTLRDMHVPSFATDEGFVYLDLA